MGFVGLDAQVSDEDKGKQSRYCGEGKMKGNEYCQGYQITQTNANYRVATRL